MLFCLEFNFVIVLNRSGGKPAEWQFKKKWQGEKSCIIRKYRDHTLYIGIFLFLKARALLGDESPAQ